jgi:dynein assembly factor 3
MSYTEGTIKAGKDKGLKKEIKGYWNDIVCSPYMAFGIDCDTPNLLTEGLFEIWNKGTGTEQHRHHAVEVSLFNMFSTLWEIETGQIYQITKKNDIYSGLGTEQSSLKKSNVELSEEELAEKEIVEELCGSNDEENNSNEIINDIEELDIDVESEKKSKDFISKGFLDEKSNTTKDIVTPPLPPTETMEQMQSKKLKQQEDELSKAIQRAECIVESLDGIKVYPMLGKPSEILNKSKYNHFFDGIFVSSRMAQSVSLDYFTNLPKKHGIISMETGKFLVPLGKDEKSTMIIKEDEIAANKGWKKVDRKYYYL